MEFISSQISDSVDAFHKTQWPCFRWFFDIFTLDIPSTTWRSLIDATIDLHGEAVGDIFKVSWEALAVAPLIDKPTKLKLAYEGE